MRDIRLEDIELSFDETYHIYKGKPLYSKRFKKVMSFHSPGLAAVEDYDGAYHIKLDGEPLYPERYLKTYGFYEGIATVVDKDGGYFHINTEGTRIHNRKFAWAGNFQESRCVVRDHDGCYFHITREGKDAYEDKYTYVGDYKYGIAVVYDFDGHATHIDKNGKPIHNKKYLELGVFHKGHAVARDEMGYFHIDKKGMPIYSKRFEWVEPFYNDYAFCKTKNGSLVIIDTYGKIIKHIIKDDMANSNNLNSLKDEIISYARLIYEKGYNSGIDGNISVKLSENEILITGSGASMGFLTKDDIVISDMHGNLIDGKRKVSSEYQLHTWIYSHLKDIGAVIHVHAPYATACSIAKLDLMKMYTTIAPIPTTKYAMPSSAEGPEKIKEYADRYEWFILPHHGVVTIGKTLRDAFFRLESVEKVAKIVITAKSANKNIEPLPSEEVIKLLKFYGLENQIRDTLGEDYESQ